MMCKQRESVALASIIVFALLVAGCRSEPGPPAVVEPGSMAPGFGQWKYVPVAGDNDDDCSICVPGEPCEYVPCEPQVVDICDFDTLADLVAIATITEVHESIVGCSMAFFVLDVEVHATVGASMPARVRAIASHGGNPPRPEVGQTRLLSLRDVDGKWYSIQSIPIVPESSADYSLTSGGGVLIDLPTDNETLFKEVSADLESYHADSPDGPCAVRSHPYSEGDERVRGWFDGCEPTVD
jgi:hypothetical protein